MMGYIYLIRSNETDKFYIGSTLKSLKARFANHKRHFKEYSEGEKKYLTSFEILKFDDAYIELYEEVEVESKAELQDIEGIYIKNCKDDPNCVNKQIPNHARLCGGIKAYQKEYKEKYVKEHAKTIKVQKAEYGKKNAEAISLKKAEYYKRNADLIRARHAEYRLKKRLMKQEQDA